MAVAATPEAGIVCGGKLRLLKLGGWFGKQYGSDPESTAILMIRELYDTLYEQIYGSHAKFSHWLLLGTAGLGKSAFALYCLFRALLEGGHCSVYFYSVHTQGYFNGYVLFSPIGGCSAYGEFNYEVKLGPPGQRPVGSNSKIRDKIIVDTKHMYQHPNGWVLYVSSPFNNKDSNAPDDSRYDDFRKSAEITICTMPTLTVAEALLAAKHVFKLGGCDVSVPRALVDAIGNSAPCSWIGEHLPAKQWPSDAPLGLRIAFAGTNPRALVTSTSYTDAALASLRTIQLTQLRQLLTSVPVCAKAQLYLSNYAICRATAWSNLFRGFTRVASLAAHEVLASRARGASAEETRNLLAHFGESPRSLASAHGALFERAGLRLLQHPSRIYSLTPLSAADNRPPPRSWPFADPAHSERLGMLVVQLSRKESGESWWDEVARVLQRTPREDHARTMFLPEQRNFAAADAFCGDGTVFQFTRSSAHSCVMVAGGSNQGGVCAIAEALQVDVIDLVFVTPPSHTISATAIPPQDGTSAQPVRTGVAVRQYQLCFERADITSEAISSLVSSGYHDEFSPLSIEEQRIVSPTTGPWTGLPLIG